MFMWFSYAIIQFRASTLMNKYILPVILFIVFYTLFLLRVHEFTLWSQVNILWDEKYPLSDLLIHPHGLRYFLVFPIFKLSEIINVEVDFLFSIIAIFMISLYSLIIVNTALIFQRPNLISLVFVFILICFVFLNVNGRGVFSFLGSSIFIYVAYCDAKMGKFYFLSFCAFLLSSVSSGTLSVFLVWFSLFWLFFRHKSAFEKTIGGFLIFSFFYFIFDFVSLFVNKNIDYFGGGFIGVIHMLSHGVGAFFFLNHQVVYLILLNLVVLLFLIFLLSFLLGIQKLKRKGWMTVVFLSSGLFFGLFGFTTALYSLPLIMILSMMAISSVFNQYESSLAKGRY